MAAHLVATGLTPPRMDGHADNYGEEDYSEALMTHRVTIVISAP